MDLVDRQSNIFRRPNKLRLGEVTHGHTHNFYHTTYVNEGGFHIRGELPEGGVIERDVFPGDSVGIRPDVLHMITAIGNVPAIERLTRLVRAPLAASLSLANSDSPLSQALEKSLAAVDAQIEHYSQCNRYDCVYSHRNPQGEVIQEYDGWNAANL